MKRLLWVCLLSLSCPHWVGAVSDTTMSVSPTAVAGTTITAADENSRNSSISGTFNAHSHSDIASSTANTFNLGDGTAGNKSLCGNAADATDSCLRWNDTANRWEIDVPTAASYNQIMVATGPTTLTNNALLVSAGGNIVDDLIPLAGTQPATYGDVSARAYNDAAISLTSGTATILTLNQERWDTDTIHSTASNTGRLTATTAGKYQMNGHAEFAATTSDGQRLLQIRLNGATIIASHTCEDDSTDSRAISCSVSAHYNLSATDYVEMIATQRVSATMNVNSSGNYSPEFEMVKAP